MLASEELRQNVSQEYRINLETYAWTEDFKQQIFNIDLDKDIEDTLNTVGDAYLRGINIGRCGLTSRYIARTFPNAKLYYGKSMLLVGTPSSPNGEHAWTIIGNKLIDTTLMISIPIERRQEFGYITEKEIASESAKILSEYETYENESKKNNQYIK